MLAALTAGRSLETAYVNNGGDIAVHLAPGAALDLGVVARLDSPAIDATARLTHDMPVRGIATSGWRGRSRSFGIADSVTVLARDAAAADAAATLIANAVTVEDPAIARRPASRARRRQRPGRPSGHRRRGAVVEGGGGGSAGPGRPRGAVDARCWTHRGGNARIAPTAPLRRRCPRARPARTLRRDRWMTPGPLSRRPPKAISDRW